MMHLKERLPRHFVPRNDNGGRATERLPRAGTLAVKEEGRRKTRLLRRCASRNDNKGELNGGITADWRFRIDREGKMQDEIAALFLHFVGLLVMTDERSEQMRLPRTF
jgi:hypothetical protein